jgi:ubiquinol oxidase
MLETIAGVPGMVAGMCRHLTSLRAMRHDGGWIHHLLHEAENERMHLMTWMRLIKPTPFDRFLIILTQGVFFNSYLLMYLFAPKVCHRFVGYLEEEAIKSYTYFLKEIDEGRIENVKAPGKKILLFMLVGLGTLRFRSLDRLWLTFIRHCCRLLELGREGNITRCRSRSSSR